MLTPPTSRAVAGRICMRARVERALFYVLRVLLHVPAREAHASCEIRCSRVLARSTRRQRAGARLVGGAPSTRARAVLGVRRQPGRRQSERQHAAARAVILLALSIRMLAARAAARWCAWWRVGAVDSNAGLQVHVATLVGGSVHKRPLSGGRDHTYWPQ